MADAQNTSSSKVDITAFSVRERLIWASRPLGFLFLAFWTLHPSSTLHADYLHLPLVGFLAGVCYGVMVFWESLRDYMGLNKQSHRFEPNRVPDEYYWGIIYETLFRNK